MEDFGRVWRLALSLTLIVSAIGMPQNPRYQGNEPNIVYMQAIRDLANVRINERDLVTNDFNDRHRQSKAPKHKNFYKDEKLLNGFIDATLDDLSVPNNTVKVIKAGRENGSHISNKHYRNTESNKTPHKLVKINQSTTVINANNTKYHRGTVGGSRTTKRPKIRTTTKTKPRPTTKSKPKPSTQVINTNQKNYAQITIKQNGTKPIRRIIKPLKTNNLKQNDFLLYHIPSPDPMPEVTSYSPESYFNPNLIRPNPEVSSLIPLEAVETASNGYPVFDEPDQDDLGPGLNIPLGQVDFNMYPIRAPTSGVKLANGEEFDPLCPSLHLSTNIFGPQSKQACPPLNIVVNSHFQQSMLPERAPVGFADTPIAAATAADTPILADPVVASSPVASAPVASLADTAAAPASAVAPVQAAAAPAASSGGSGGFPMFPSLPELPKLPDLKGLFGVLRGLWSILSWLFRFIWPILVAIPTIVFFKTLFVAFFVLFPWWLPVLIIAGKSAGHKEKPKIHYKHIHPPVVVHHPDGWFWNQKTKTWVNLDGTKAKPYTHRSDDVLGMIDDFRKKYFGRRSPAIGETLKQLTVSLLESINATAPTKYQDPVPTFDTRTPPKVKQQMKKDKLEEKSHPGIAEPVDDEELILEEHEKKMNYYKVDRPTTDSGLSTWILLSGQASSTAKPMKRPLPRNVTNTYVVEDEPVMNIKPLFKRRSTTKKPTATTTTTAATTTTATTTTTTTTQRPTKLTKVKASLLAGVNKNATNFSKKTTTVKATTTTITTPKPTKATKVTTVSTTKKPTTVTTTKRPTTEFVRVSTMNTPVVINETRVSSAALAPEAKEGELDLTNNKKTRKPSTTHKRKKNKNKKRRPTAEDKVDVSNSTKVASKIKEKPFGTQIYNYLSREVMPTVGVGLVGLMVTAGLASYFLYPFSPVRRSYEVDRKDKVTPYYYNDEYSGGIAEEEAIGKVIAGMPQNANTNTNYNVRAQNSRNTYNRYRNVDQRYMQGSVETVKLNHKSSYGGDEVIVGSPKASYGQTTENDDEQKFVVGSIPKELQGNLEEVDPTPVVVPEHGPRNIEEKEQVFVVHSVPATETAALKIEHGPRRRRRQSYEENEIDVDGHKTTETTIETTTTTTPKTTTTNKPTLTTTKNPIVVKTESFIHLIKDLFYFKIRMGLEILQNKTETLTKYFKSAQTRIDDAYVKNHQPHM